MLTGNTVAGLTGNSGPWSYQFSSPTSITFDPYGYMYVLDTGNSRIQKWLPGAAYGTTVVAVTMSSPYGLQTDRLGNLVVADTSYHRIISFSMTCRK
jgi:sugar lactone lactonase YvrE